MCQSFDCEASLTRPLAFDIAALEWSLKGVIGFEAAVAVVNPIAVEEEITIIRQKDHHLQFEEVIGVGFDQ